MNKTLRGGDSLLINRILLSKQFWDHGSDNEPVGWFEKYFLIRATHIFGENVIIAESTDILVPTLGVSYKNICQSLKALSALGIVTMEMVTKDRGRPVKAFRIESDGILEYFQADDYACQKLAHQPLIDSLLCWGEYDEDTCSDLGRGQNTRSRRAYLQDENHTLDGKSRMLLAVLLAHADVFGFVESFGQAEIEAITSFSADQQRRLVKALLDKNYIRSVIKGFTCSHIFGRVETLYCLNTCKGNISGQPAYRITLTHSSVAHQANEFSEAFQLWHLAYQLRKGTKSTESDRYLWLRSLVDQNHGVVDLSCCSIGAISMFFDKSLVDYLQFRLETYATWVLEKPDFNGRESEILDAKGEEILQKIRCDAFPDSGKDNIKERLSTPEIKDAAAQILFQIACVIAQKYHQYLSLVSPSSLAGYQRKYRVFPRLSKKPTFESMSLAIASLKTGKKLTNDLFTEYAYYRDLRADKMKCIQEFHNAQVQRRLIGNDYHAQLMEIQNKADFSEAICNNEEMLDKNLRRLCGLMS